MSGLPSHYTVMSRGSVGHLHSRELEETLAQSHTAQQQLSGNIILSGLETILLQLMRDSPVTSVARPVFMLRTTVATSDTVNVLIALKIIILMKSASLATQQYNLTLLLCSAK